MAHGVITVLLATLALLFHQATAPAGAVALGRHNFTLPAGLKITQVAGSPLVDRPVSAVFDARGRLYVTESSGSNEPAAVQAEKRPHRVLRLVDDNGDGVFDRRTVFADNLMLPQGICVVGEEVWVGAPPKIWRLIDADDDGVAEKRILWHDGGTLTGCMNDLHGPAVGPDGFIYWTKGAFAEQKHPLGNGETLTTKGSHIFCARPDGSGRQAVLNGGMDNPVGVAFSSLGDVFLTCTFVHHPGSGIGLRDGVLHAVEGGLWGKDHAPIREPQHVWTSPDLMPVLVDLGPAAPSGLTMARSERLGLKDRLLSCQFNLRRVQAHALQNAGSALSATTKDLVVSDHPDFHPTDVVEDADGSVLVVDTGGWYKLCCPSSQMVKDQSLGAIYRISKLDSPAVDDARGLKIANMANTALLSDYRPVVRERALAMLVSQGLHKELNAYALNSANGTEARVLALWGLCRIGTQQALGDLVSLLNNPTEEIRLVAARAVARQQFGGGKDSLAKLVLQDPSATVRRAAVEALVAQNAGPALPDLLKAIRAPDSPKDRAWAHAITRGLVLALKASPQGDANIGQAFLTAAESGPHKRLVLTALDQAKLVKTPAETLALAKSAVPEDRRIARWILTRHPDWSSAIANEVAKGPPPAWLDAELLAVLMNDMAIQKLMGEWVGTAHASLALEAMSRWQGKQVPAGWVDPLLKRLQNRAAPDTLHVIATMAKKGPLPENWIPMLEALSNTDYSLPINRLLAKAALPSGHTESDKGFGTIVNYLSATISAPERQAAMEALDRVKPTAKQWRLLAEKLGEASVGDQARLVNLFQSKDTAAGQALAEALVEGKIPATVATPVLRAALAGHSKDVMELAEPALSKRDPSASAQRALVEKLLKELPAGDINRGHEVFNNPKTACASCHRIGYKGGLAGPELTAIGKIRTQRDLLEAIIAPSASFVRSYEPVTISLTSGKLISGIPKGETATEIRLQTGPEVIDTIPRGQIEEMTQGTVSLMPAGIDKQISLQELADLIAFLMARK
ncbi:MAG: dehydrogenase [Planctomycetota bacterium]|nr:MAG: dehydrogenase [Planctomycetota bacterium]